MGVIILSSAKNTKDRLMTLFRQQLDLIDFTHRDACLRVTANYRVVEINPTQIGAEKLGPRQHARLCMSAVARIPSHHPGQLGPKLGWIRFIVHRCLLFCCLASLPLRFSLQVRLLLCNICWYRVLRTVPFERYLLVFRYLCGQGRLHNASGSRGALHWPFLFVLHKVVPSTQTCTSTKGGQLAITYFVRHAVSKVQTQNANAVIDL